MTLKAKDEANKWLIPWRFKVGRRWYDVRLVRTVERPKGCVGNINFVTRLIQVATHAQSGRPLTSDVAYNTFWHETTHAILADMAHPLARNEKFVTAFADRLTKVILTAEFENAAPASPDAFMSATPAKRKKMLKGWA